MRATVAGAQTTWNPRISNFKFDTSNLPASRYKGRVKKPPAPASEKPLSLALRRYLYLTAATTGGAIMVVEILGAKMLAPYVGTSHFVWTAQIAVTLVALATGYYAGGWLVDRRPKLELLYAAVLVAGLYLCGATLVIRPIAYWCLDFRLALGSLLASALLFFVPLSLLAMVGPFFVRVLTTSVNGVGGNVGRLTALGTLGSFGGTVLIGYVLIPYVPNSLTLVLSAGLLFLLVALYFLIWGRPARHAPAVGTAIGLGVLLGVLGVRAEGEREGASSIEVFRGNSNFGLLQVINTASGAQRYYLNDYLIQNTYDPAEKKSLSMFTDMLHELARAYAPRVERVLCIGLGVGIVPMQFAREGAAVDVAEINPAVVPVAQRFFGCEPDRLSLHLDDGRHFLNRTTNRYDAIILDAFLGDSSPSHLMSREAFAAMRRVLNPGGVLVINSFADFHPRQDFYGCSLDKTLKSVFASVRIHSTGRGNVFFVAADQPVLEVRREPDLAAVHDVVREQVRAAFASHMVANPDHGIVLTDDFNPVEFYDAANREAIRRDLARGMRLF
jgi:spermidine synthase